MSTYPASKFWLLAQLSAILFLGACSLDGPSLIGEPVRDDGDVIVLPGPPVGPGPEKTRVGTGHYVYLATNNGVEMVEWKNGEMESFGFLPTGDKEHSSVVISRNKKYLVVAGLNTGNIFCFEINPSSGLLQLVAQERFGTRPTSLVFHPNGKYLFAVMTGDHAVVSIEFDENTGQFGSTSVVNGSLRSPVKATINSLGTFLYVANVEALDPMGTVKNITEFAINPTDGTLSNPNQIQTGEFTVDVVLDEVNSRMYALAATIDAIAQYNFDPVAGVTDPTIQSFYITRGAGDLVRDFPISMKLVQTLAGLVMYISIHDKDEVRLYDVDPTTGALNRRAGLYGSGDTPSLINLNIETGLMYIANRLTRSFSVYRWDPADGNISLLKIFSAQNVGAVDSKSVLFATPSP